jgi:hypothetical protein
MITPWPLRVYFKDTKWLLADKLGIHSSGEYRPTNVSLFALSINRAGVVADSKSGPLAVFDHQNLFILQYNTSARGTSAQC